MNRIFILLLLSFFLISCTGREHSTKVNQISMIMNSEDSKKYSYNLEFLKKYVNVIELKNGNAAVALVASWQGRVMTSTSEGASGFSFGWINHELISSQKVLSHINAFGGEERLWLGPEGGQFAIFFKKGDEFIYDNWQTPAFLDTIPFKAISVTETSAIFAYDVDIENYSGTPFKIGLVREVILLNNSQILEETGLDLNGLNFVAYRSNNKLINKGTTEWEKDSGQLSIWMLGMFNPSPSVTVVIPVNPGDEKELGVKVNDNYFGKISEDRLKVSHNIVYFRADGKSRGKIGIPPLRSKGIMGSYDFENNILTLLICRIPKGIKEYVNSAWQIQKDPYSGDAMNSYNDGPLQDGSQMGPFYELEASSPAAGLKPGENILHSQITIHITGKRESLNNAAIKSLGVSLDEIRKAFE